MSSDVKFNFFVGKILSLNRLITFKLCDSYSMTLYGFHNEREVGVAWYILEGRLGCYKTKKKCQRLYSFYKKTNNQKRRKELHISKIQDFGVCT